MDRYAKGILTAYARVIDSIDNMLDSGINDDNLLLLKGKILLSSCAYKLYLSEPAKDDFDYDIEHTMQQINLINSKLGESKILEIPKEYFGDNFN